MEQNFLFIKENNIEIRVKLLELGLLQSEYCNSGSYLSVNLFKRKFYQLTHKPYKNSEFKTEMSFLNHIKNYLKIIE